MNEIYDFPLYYDIAFSYRDFALEVDEIQRAFERFSQRPMHSVLELACGHAPHMAELIRRGYSYTGLDISDTMLNYAKKQAAQAGLKADFASGDLVAFTLPSSFDAVLTMLGSLYIESTDDLLQHLRSVGAALRPGGIYFLDWCVDFEPLMDKQQFWQESRGEICVNVAYQTKITHPAEQLFSEEIILHVHDQQRDFTIENTGLRRAIYPQEFRLALQLVPELEFVGWFNDWNIDQPLDGFKQIDRPIIVLRRRRD